jgi:hypothetical protein
MEMILDGYADIKEAVRRKDSYLYERWKAGGFLVDGGILSDYPNLEQVVEQMESAEELESDEDEDEQIEE